MLERWIPDRDSTILVVAADATDKGVFQALGFRNVTISNLDSRINASEFEPFNWRSEDAEDLQLSDGSYDYVVVHAGLHHLRSPHRGLTEMYRVARKGAIIFEARDSMTMRWLERLNLTQTFEHAAVFYSGSKFGGVSNTEIPNYVYRWTERELEKTIASYAPTAKHSFRYGYGIAVPSTPALERGNMLKMLTVTLITPLFQLFSALFPKQKNLFAAFIEKPAPGERLHPWLRLEDAEIKFNHEWAAERYHAQYKVPE